MDYALQLLIPVLLGFYGGYLLDQNRQKPLVFFGWTHFRHGFGNG